MNVEAPFSLALVAGGFAGTSVDVALYPLDTLRTRLQSTEGFWKAGGYQNIYRGLHAAAIGAAPTAAVFFSTYEGSKKLLARPGGEAPWWSPSAAATAGEIGACVVRVPTAVVTQRMQVGRYNQVAEAVRSIWASGGARAFYTGYWATVAREIPFSFIQFPIYERLKIFWASKQGTETTPVQGAACGSAAGLIAGVLTTPLDVVKTRRMLENMTEGKKKYTSTLQSLQTICAEEGPRGFVKGIGPRAGWITMGGFVFFGAYELSLQTLRRFSIWE